MTTRPYDFEWIDQPRPQPLVEWIDAPDAPGFYELGWMHRSGFDPCYGGTTRCLMERLGRHHRRSHHPLVQRHREHLWFRCKALPDRNYAKFVEAMYIAAYDYPWNRRQEWKAQCDGVAHCMRD